MASCTQPAQAVFQLFESLGFESFLHCRHEACEGHLDPLLQPGNGSAVSTLVEFAP